MIVDFQSAKEREDATFAERKANFVFRMRLAERKATILTFESNLPPITFP